MDAINEQLLQQQPIKRIGIKPPKISDEHAGLLDDDIEMIQSKAALEGKHEQN